MVICAAGAVHGSVSPAARLYPKFPIILTLQDSPDTNFLIFLHRAAESSHNRHRDIRFNEIYLLNIHSVATLHAKTKTI